MRVEGLYPAESKNIRERSCSTDERSYSGAGRKSGEKVNELLRWGGKKKKNHHPDDHERSSE